MDLGTLVAAIQIKDNDFERVLNKAAQTAKTTEQKVQQALSGIEMDVDASSFDRAMSDAPKSAKTASQQITQAVSDVDRVLQQQTKAVQDNARAWAQNRLDPARVQELKTLGVATEDYIQAISGVPGAQSKVRSALEGNSSALKNLEQDTRAVAEAQKDFDRTVSQIAATLDKQNGAVTENTRVWAANKIGTDNLRILEQLGVKTSEYVDAVVGVPGALQRMQTALDGQGDALNRLNTLTGQVSQAQRDFALRQRAIGDSTQGAAQDVNRAAGLIDRAGDASARATPLVGGLGNAFDKARTAMIALFAASTFVDFIREAVQAASDFEQSAGGVTAVFADASREIEDFGRTSAQSVGLATAEYQNMATVFGSQLKNMGTSVADLAPMTNKLIILGADLAAQYGGSTSDAVESLSALLRGERDPIEKYGVGIKQADVNARLAAEGLDNLTGSAAKNAELQATLAILTEQTASAQGAFGRETDTLAHKQQVANAEFENAKAKIGDQLIPLWATFTDMLANDGVPALEAVAQVLGPVADFLASVVGLFADLPGPLQAAVIALGGVVLLNGPLARTGTALWGIVSGSSAAAASMTRFAFTAKAALGALGGPLGLAIVAITTALSFMGSESDDTAVSVEGLAAVVDDATGKFKDNAKEIAISEVVASGLAQQYAEMGGNVEDLVLALIGNEAAQARVNAKSAEYEKYAKTNEDIDLQKRFAEGYTNGLNTIADAQDKGTIKAKLNEESQKQLAKVQGESGDAAEDSKAKWDDLSDSQKLAADSAKFVSEKLKDAAEQAKLLADQTEAARWLGEFKSKADDAARSADILKERIDTLDGRSRSLDDATAAQVSSLAALKQAFKDGTKAATENAEAGNLNTGALAEWNVAALNATSDGRALYQQLSGMVDAHTDLVSAAYNSAVAEGDVAGAADRAQQAAHDSRQAFIDLAAQYLGGNVEAAQALADKLGILDEQKVDDKTFEVIGDDAKAQEAVRKANEAVVNDKLFQIRADAVDALLQAQNLNEQLKEIDGKEVRWHAIGNLVISVTKQDAADANAKAANFGYGATDYGFGPGGATGGRVGELLRGFAGGGQVSTDGKITGPGGPKDDLVVGFGPDGKPLRLSNDETIMNGQASKRWGWLFALMNAGRFAEGGSIDGSTPAGPATVTEATLQGSVTAPDPAVIQAAWDQIAAIVEASWTGGILPVLAAMAEQNVTLATGFHTLADEQGSAYEQINTQTQGVGTTQTWLRDTITQGWQSIQATHINTTNAVIAGAYSPMQTWLVNLGTAQQTLAATTDSAWSQIGARIQGTYDGQIVPAWTGVQGFASATGSFFDGINSGVGSATAKIIEDLAQITAAIDTFFGMVDTRSGGSSGGSGDVSVTIPGRARGGLVPGADLGRDSTIIAARGREAIMVPQFTDAVGGSVGVDRLNRLAEAGQLQGFARGGVIGDTISHPLDSIVTEGAQKAIEAGIDKLFTSVGGFASNGNWGPGTDGSGLAANTQAARDFIVKNWGITNIGGVYGGSVPGSDHPIGKALDVMIANYLSAAGIAQGTSVADWFIQHPDAFGTKYVIWRDRINQGGAWAPYQHPSGSNDTLQHRDHVHLSFLTGGGSFSGQAVGDKPSGGDWLSQMLDRIKSSVPASSGTAGGGVEQWRDELQYVLRLLGQDTPANEAAGMLQISTESSGNDKAINRTDSNAQKGTPSKGLVQVIDPTFAAMAKYSPIPLTNIWDPIQNLMAGALWAIHGHGSIAQGWRGVAYDGGGPLKQGWTMAYNGTGHDEWVSTSKPEKTTQLPAQAAEVTIVLKGGDAITREMVQVSQVVVDGKFVNFARSLEQAST